MTFRSVLLFIVAFAALGSNGVVAQTVSGGPILQDVDLSQRTEDYQQISILVEIGVVAPPITLLQLSAPSDIVLEITSGPAEFLYSEAEGGALRRLQRISYRSDTVRLPQLVVGKGISSLSILVDDVPVGDPLRIADLDEGVIELWLTMKTTRPAILEIDQKARYVVADLSKLAREELEHDVEEMDLGEGDVSTVSGDGEEGHLCPELIWYRPKSTDFFPEPSSCVLNLRPWGRVEFLGVPASGYSVKPESVDNQLIWATDPTTDFIDGLYRTSWGCDVALKVPGNVIAKVHSTTASCCRGALALVAGERCRWVDPSNNTPGGGYDTWPDCPLS